MKKNVGKKNLSSHITKFMDGSKQKEPSTNKKHVSIYHLSMLDPSEGYKASKKQGNLSVFLC